MKLVAINKSKEPLKVGTSDLLSCLVARFSYPLLLYLLKLSSREKVPKVQGPLRVSVIDGLSPFFLY